jgi:hypothetical protein
MKTARLIIDVQQALCTGEFAAFEVDRVIDRINLVSQTAREAGVMFVVTQLLITIRLCATSAALGLGRWRSLLIR